jgi:hypothetical protein
LIAKEADLGSAHCVEEKMASLKQQRRLQGFVAMPDGHRHTPRLHGLLNQVAGDYKIDLIFAHERLPTHLLPKKNLRQLVARSDFVLCFTDGRDLDIAFEAGLAFGLQKPFVLVLLPETQRVPATFMGHFYVELSGDDADDRESLRVMLAGLVADLAGEDIANATRVGRSVRFPRMGCAVGRSAGCSDLRTW